MSITLFVPYPTLTFAPIFVAADTGALARHAPEVDVHLGGHDRFLGVLQGEEPGIIPLVHMGLRAYDRGHPFKIINTVFHEVVHRVVARPHIAALTDLRGRTVMVNAFRGASDLEARYVLRKAGVRPEEVRFMEAGPDLEMAQLNALRSGEVDAIASSAPYWFIAEQEGLRVLGDVGEFYADWTPSSLVVTADWAAANLDLARRIRLAFEDAVTFIRDREDEVFPLLLERIPELRPEMGPPLISHMRSGWDPARAIQGLRNYVSAYCSEFRTKEPAVEDLLLFGTA